LGRIFDDGEPPVPYAEVNGQRLFYEDSGGDGPAVAFSHGFLMDHSMFDPQVASLSDRHRCVTWDERGHGQTGATTGPFSYWDSADDLAALLRSLGITSVVLAGMSQGGYLSLRAALAQPDLVRGLILIDTQAGTENPELMPYYRQLVERWLTSGLDDELAGTIAAIILGQGYPDADRWIRQWREVGPETLQEIFATLGGRDDLRDRVGEIGVPALAIHGDQDAAISLDRAEALAGALPDAELVVIEGAGHASNLSHPDLVNPHIERFLSERL
jgi:pimeloyl-ACP methyl ester carboxylesterase